MELWFLCFGEIVVVAYLNMLLQGCSLLLLG